MLLGDSLVSNDIFECLIPIPLGFGARNPPEGQETYSTVGLIDYEYHFIEYGTTEVKKLWAMTMDYR